MSANGIAHLPNKRQRQEQKLALAASKRAGEGKRSTLKKAQLPTMYSAGGNNNTEDRKLMQDGVTAVSYTHLRAHET